MFAALLSAFWLVAPARCLLEPLGLFASDHCCQSMEAPMAAGAPSKQEQCSLEQSSRWLCRRVEVRAEVVVRSPPGEWLANFTAEFRPAGLGCRQSDAQMELERGWQFRWQAALPPRAPSLVPA